MGEGADVLQLIVHGQVPAMRESTHSCGSWGCFQEASVKESDLQPAKPLWHEDTRGPRRNHPQNLVITDAAQRMVQFNLQVSTVLCRQYRIFDCWKASPPPFLQKCTIGRQADRCVVSTAWGLWADLFYSYTPCAC